MDFNTNKVRKTYLITCQTKIHLKNFVFSFTIGNRINKISVPNVNFENSRFFSYTFAFQITILFSKIFHFVENIVKFHFKSESK